MPTQPITIRTIPATDTTPALLKAFHPDGTEITNIRSLAINAPLNDVVTATIVTADLAIDALTAQATITDGSLTTLCDALITSLNHITTQCNAKATDRKQKHIHMPAAILAEHIAKQVSDLRKTLAQATTATPAPPAATTHRPV